MRLSEIISREEQKKALAIMLAMCGLAHYRRKEMQKRWLAPEQKPGFVDHPAVTYLMENISLFAAAYAVLRIAPKPSQTASLPVTVASSIFTGLLLTTPMLNMSWAAATYVYSHVPWFSSREVPTDMYTLVKENLLCNIPATLLGDMIVHRLLKAIPPKAFHKSINQPTPIKVFPFLAKYLFCRIVVDIVFGIAHRIMHEYPTVYNLLHKRHHEHTTPRSATNYHFHFLDLFIEAFVPINAAFMSLAALGYAPNYIEQNLLVVPLIYFESGSHTGKEIPLVTWFPMLSPLVDWITGCDQRLIEYHTRHHQLFRCNYSISPWFDKMCGTYRMEFIQSKEDK